MREAGGVLSIHGPAESYPSIVLYHTASQRGRIMRLISGGSRMKDDGTFTKNFEGRPKGGKPLSWDKIKRRLKDERGKKKCG